MALNMPASARRGDLRIVKTAKVLNAAMFVLLERNNFGKITVRDICEEAQISRATFYARFADKYDFLKSWLINLKPEGIDIENCEKTQKRLNDFIHKNKKLVKNLVCDVDNETLKILSEFVFFVFNWSNECDIKPINPEQIVLSNFFAGGLIYYFQWQVKNKFPPEITPMNIYLHDIIKKFREWKIGAI